MTRHRGVCAYIAHGGDRAEFLAEFQDTASPSFDPDRDLQRIGLANQTTMLMSESLEIGELCRQTMLTRYGAAALADHFRAFDTICSATQDRQDAVEALLAQEALDLMIVVGGFNSSNTRNLARICAARLPTYHVADAAALGSTSEIRHRSTDAGPGHEVATSDWLPATGSVRIGLTAGASTPNNIIGQVVRRLEAAAGVADG